MINKICAGVFAQVDAGKTTLCESILFFSKVIRKRGSVDDGNTFFDFNPSEIQHGITVFSKEATFMWNNTCVSIIDTPGHRDFGAEVDRILPVVDVLIFVVNSAEIDKPRNAFLFKKLAACGKPVILFVSKMDTDRITVSEASASLSNLYSELCIHFSQGEPNFENAATLDETYFEAFLENKKVPQAYTIKCVRDRVMFPVIFGSGMTGEGVSDLLDLVAALGTSLISDSPAENKAYVFKIDRDNKGIRQTHVRIISGSFPVRTVLNLHGIEKPVLEKINEIRQLNGSHYQNLQIAEAGDIVVLTGLTSTQIGQIIGGKQSEVRDNSKSLGSIVYSVSCAEPNCTAKLMDAMHLLGEEDPSLIIHTSDNAPNNIQIHLRGDLQKELLIDTFKNRFGLSVLFGEPKADLFETIGHTVYGNGHFEPLRHYAEVKLELTPLPVGSGLQFESRCPEDVLSINWQNTIIHALKRTEIRGVLTGSPITDIKITLLTGRAHIKHTEGGDFREAAVRAVRQALMKADSVLLEPYASFLICCSTNLSGRILTELEKSHLSVETQQVNENQQFQIKGTGPLLAVDKLRKAFLQEKGDAVLFEYEPVGLRSCENAQEIISEIQYDPLADISQSPDSIFCFHGAGHPIRWDEADAFMHSDPKEAKQSEYFPAYVITEAELRGILSRNALLDDRTTLYRAPVSYNEPVYSLSHASKIYLIDGSNLLHAYIGNEKCDVNRNPQYLSVKKDALVTDLINYFQYIAATAKIVFDGNAIDQPSIEEIPVAAGISMLYSGSESADVLLERLASQIGPDYHCKMVTSDRMIQISALRSGVTRISSREFLEEMNAGLAGMREAIKAGNTEIRNSLSDIVQRH